MTKGNNTIVLLITLMIVALPVYFGNAGEVVPVDAKTIVEKMDRLYRSDASYAELVMIIVNPNWERTLRLKIWTEGMKKTFITILAPKKDYGISTLRIDREMWNFFPKISKVMKVPPSMMMGSWMGSDFTNDDLVKESTLINDYESTLITPKDADSSLYYVQMVPKEKTPSVWGKIILKVRKKDFLPVEQEFYDEKGIHMRSMYFKDIKEIGGRVIPSKLELIPLHKEGHKTIVQYIEAEFDKPLTDDVFSLRNLQKIR